jgi:hypothetical protein
MVLTMNLNLHPVSYLLAVTLFAAATAADPAPAAERAPACDPISLAEYYSALATDVTPIFDAARGHAAPAGRARIAVPGHKPDRPSR